MALIQAGCILRPSWTTNTPGSAITWSFVDDADHRPEYFNSVGLNPAGNAIVLGFPPVDKIISFNVTVDETLEKYCTVPGPSVALSSAAITMSALLAGSFQLHGNGTGWNSAPLTSSWSGGTTTISGIISLSDTYAYGTVAQYFGTNPYITRPVMSGLAVGQWKFKLINMTTGTEVTTAPTVDDKVLITPPITPAPVPLSAFDGNGFAKKIYQATSAPANSTGNLFIDALFEIED